MAGLHFELVSPARLLFSGDVSAVTVPGTEGDMTVLPDHAPLLSTLRPGFVVVGHEGSAQERIFVRGGFAEINGKGLTVLAETAIPMAELNVAALQAEISTAEADLAGAVDEDVKRRAQETLTHLVDIKTSLASA